MMVNIATELKNEIARLAAKEVRAETLEFRMATGHHRSDITALKGRVLSLEQQLRRVSHNDPPSCANAAANASPGVRVRTRRFSAMGLAAQRTRLGLSVNQMGTLAIQMCQLNRTDG